MHPAAAIQGHMTLKVGAVTKDHKMSSLLKCESFSLRDYRDMKHLHATPVCLIAPENKLVASICWNYIHYFLFRDIKVAYYGNGIIHYYVCIDRL